MLYCSVCILVIVSSIPSQAYNLFTWCVTGFVFCGKVFVQCFLSNYACVCCSVYLTVHQRVLFLYLYRGPLTCVLLSMFWNSSTRYYLFDLLIVLFYYTYLLLIVLVTSTLKIEYFSLYNFTNCTNIDIKLLFFGHTSLSTHSVTDPSGMLITDFYKKLQQCSLPPFCAL